jgi:hypothetical protein
MIACLLGKGGWQSTKLGGQAWRDLGLFLWVLWAFKARTRPQHSSEDARPMSSRLRTEGIPPISRPYTTPCHLSPYGDPGPRIGLYKVWQSDTTCTGRCRLLLLGRHATWRWHQSLTSFGTKQWTEVTEILTLRLANEWKDTIVTYIDSELITPPAFPTSLPCPHRSIAEDKHPKRKPKRSVD